MQTMSTTKTRSTTKTVTTALVGLVAGIGLMAAVATSVTKVQQTKLATIEKQPLEAQQMVTDLEGQLQKVEKLELGGMRVNGAVMRNNLYDLKTSNDAKADLISWYPASKWRGIVTNKGFWDGSHTLFGGNKGAIGNVSPLDHVEVHNKIMPYDANGNNDLIQDMPEGDNAPTSTTGNDTTARSSADSSNERYLQRVEAGGAAYYYRSTGRNLNFKTASNYQVTNVPVEQAMGPDAYWAAYKLDRFVGTQQSLLKSIVAMGKSNMQQIYSYNNVLTYSAEVKFADVQDLMNSFGFDYGPFIGSADKKVNIQILKPKKDNSVFAVYIRGQMWYWQAEIEFVDSIDVPTAPDKIFVPLENYRYFPAMSAEFNKNIWQNPHDALRWLIYQPYEKDPQDDCDQLKQLWMQFDCSCDNTLTLVQVGDAGYTATSSQTQVCADLRAAMIKEKCDPCIERDPLDCTCDMVDVMADGTYKPNKAYGKCFDKDGKLKPKCTDCIDAMQKKHMCDQPGDDLKCDCDMLDKGEDGNVYINRAYGTCFEKDTNGNETVTDHCLECYKKLMDTGECFPNEDPTPDENCVDTDGAMNPWKYGETRGYYIPSNSIIDHKDVCMIYSEDPTHQTGWEKVEECKECYLKSGFCDEKNNANTVIVKCEKCVKGECVLEDDVNDPDDTTTTGDPGTTNDNPNDNPNDDYNLPDLSADSIDYKSQYLTLGYSNIGTGNAPEKTGHIYVWIDDKLEWTYSISTLNCQDHANAGGKCELQPQTNLTGNHVIAFCVDTKNVITESNEKNNCYKVNYDTDGGSVIEVIPIDSDDGNVATGDPGNNGSNDDNDINTNTNSNANTNSTLENCTDTDAGYNIEIKGTTGGTHNDYCLLSVNGQETFVPECNTSDPNCYLKEGVCENDTTKLANDPCDGYTKCMDGACQAQSTPDVTGPSTNLNVNTGNPVDIGNNFTPGGDM